MKINYVTSKNDSFYGKDREVMKDENQVDLINTEFTVFLSSSQNTISFHNRKKNVIIHRIENADTLHSVCQNAIWAVRKLKKSKLKKWAGRQDQHIC